MNDGDRKNVQPSTITEPNTRTLNDRSDGVEQEAVQHVPYNFTAQVTNEKFSLQFNCSGINVNTHPVVSLLCYRCHCAIRCLNKEI